MKDPTKPLKPVNEHGNSVSHRDEAKGGYSLTALEDLLSDCDTQPEWRPRADKAHAYYDFQKQLTPEKIQKIRQQWGIEPTQINLVHGVINGVLGQEAKSRTDVKLEADDDDFADATEALNQKHKEAQRETNIDMMTSGMYADGVKGGVGWVEVSKATDPLDYPYRVKVINRRDIWWDMRPGMDLGLAECRWQVRKRWVDLDEAVAAMPEHKDILKACIYGWDTFNLPDDDANPLTLAYNRERNTRIQRQDWADARRRMVKFYEVWYRVPAETVVIEMARGRAVQLDPSNPLHVQAVERGLYPVRKTKTMQIRMALFAGPHRLLDTGTTRRRFPYIPFFAFRDDEDGSPYGLIEGMIAPQDEFNDRRQMVNWMLQARQLQMDSDALDLSHNTISDVVETMMRPDFVAITNPNRRNAQGLRIGNDLQLQREQFELMQDSKQLIQDVPRVYSSMLGNAATGVTSGVANNLLIEQGMVAMGELNDNFRFARRLVHESLLDLIVEDHLDEDLQVRVGTGKGRRTIVLNTWGPNGEPINRIKDAPIRVGLSDVPSTAGMRMQEQQLLGQVIQALAGVPQALAVLAPAYVEGSTLSNRKQMAEDLRTALGVPQAEDKEAAMQAQQQAQQAAQEAQAIQKAVATAEAEKKQAEALEAKARVDFLGSQTLKNIAEVTQMTAANEDELIAQAIQEAMAS